MKASNINCSIYAQIADMGEIKAIPQGWKIKRLKEISDVKNSNVDKNLLKEEIPISLCNYVDVYNNDMIDENINFMKASAKPDEIKNFLLRKYDILITKDSESHDDIANPALVLKDFEDVLCGYHLSQIRCHPKIIYAPYLHRLFQAQDFGYRFHVQAKGITRVGLGQSALLDAFVPLPPLSEQKSIAKYLNRKIKGIDREIILLEEKSKLYKELKQSLINETVTRGLNKSTPLRNSGIEWIVKIPKHWKVRRVVDIASQQKIRNIGLKNKNLLSLSYGRIVRRNFDTAHGLLPESFETYQIVHKGNIILRLTDLQNDQKSLRVGLVKEKGIITSAYLNLNFIKDMCSTYFYYLLHSFDIAKVFYWQGGGLRQSMKFDDIKVLPIILPPLNEQKIIAEYLDEKTVKIDKIVKTIGKQINLLKELRKTLINDVVTGKIRVPEKAEASI